MKIRIKGNSLRYRLTKSDVKQLEEQGYIEEHCNIAGQLLTYALQRDDSSNLSASFTNNKITLFMPATLAAEWISTDRIGFEHQYGNLYLLIEKDFKCLDNVAEDQSDNYPNPLSNPK